MASEIDITFKLNGHLVRASVHPAMALLELVREKFQLTGSKLACGEGECGACAMLLDDQPVLGCLTPAVDVDGREVKTVESFQDHGKLSRLQRAFINEGAVQCGYCTPGMLVSAAAILHEHPHPTTEQVRRGLEGNVCRCTGYVAIVEAVEAAGKEEA